MSRPEPRSRAEFVGLGTAWGGGVGALVGLIVGLDVHPATAWFAAFEIGFPAALVGALAGLGIGSVVLIRRNS
jgi:hypothetical protein